MSRFRYKLYADLLLAVHILWVFLLAGGTVFIFYNRWYIKYHIALVTGTLVLNLVLRGCPLTRLEEKYRKAWNPEVYYCPNSFLATYLRRFFGLKVSSAQARWVLIMVKITSYYVSILLLTKIL